MNQSINLLPCGAYCHSLTALAVAVVSVASMFLYGGYARPTPKQF